MNLYSSRSHAVFSLTCTQTKTMYDSSTKDEVVNTIVSKVNLVDLAGSEVI